MAGRAKKVEAEMMAGTRRWDRGGVYSRLAVFMCESQMVCEDVWERKNGLPTVAVVEDKKKGRRNTEARKVKRRRRESGRREFACTVQQPAGTQERSVGSVAACSSQASCRKWPVQ